MLEPLTPDALFQRLRELVELQRWSVSVALITGDIMVGTLLPVRVPYTDVGKKKYAYYPLAWGQPDDPSLAAALWLREIQLVYPSGGGTKGISVCELEAEKIVAVWPLGWKLDASVAAITGPLAVAIHKANEAAAAGAGVQTFRLASASLQVPRQIEVEGIWLQSYEPLYIDHSYFERLPSLDISVGIPGVEAQYTRGVETVAKAVLKGSLAKLIVPLPIVHEVGLITPSSDDVTTEMEGETWRLAVFIRRTASVHGESLPVLFRASAVRYPVELWHFIRSPVTMVAENRQIPMRSGDHQWSRSLVARAIGFVGD